MKINNIGYNHSHSADFQIERPTGSGDYLLLLIKTPATFTFDEVDYHTVPNSFILYKKGTPQYYRGYNTIYTDDWNISDMANQLSISKSYFQHLYKLVFDTSAIDDVIQSRITYAKYLLNNTSLSVKEIASECGYNNESYFMRQFKKFAGSTPSNYRAHPIP